MRKNILVSIFLIITILSINGISQTQQDTLKIILLSQEHLKKDYSETGFTSQLVYECSELLDCDSLRYNGVAILNTDELFNNGYCVWYKLMTFEMNIDKARMELSREVCNANYEKKNFELFFVKIDNHWVLQ